MISKEQLPELVDFARVERGLPLAENKKFGTLVVPTDNAEYPGHRWFKYKESFSSRLLAEILHALGYKKNQRIRLLDPFCGVGTTLLAAQEMSALGYKIEAIGIDCHPFAAFVARTKSLWHQ